MLAHSRRCSTVLIVRAFQPRARDIMSPFNQLQVIFPAVTTKQGIKHINVGIKVTESWVLRKHVSGCLKSAEIYAMDTMVSEIHAIYLIVSEIYAMIVINYLDMRWHNQCFPSASVIPCSMQLQKCSFASFSDSAICSFMTPAVEIRFPGDCSIVSYHLHSWFLPHNDYSNGFPGRSVCGEDSSVGWARSALRSYTH